MQTHNYVHTVHVRSSLYNSSSSYVYEHVLHL